MSAAAVVPKEASVSKLFTCQSGSKYVHGEGAGEGEGRVRVKVKVRVSGGREVKVYLNIPQPN
jgi:hypothetical protein